MRRGRSPPNRERALFWYRRAYRRGEACAATNIGVLYRDEGDFKLALIWFERAVQRGDEEANLEIAKVFLKQDREREPVVRLKRVAKAKPGVDVTVASWEQARRLLKRLM